MFHVPVLDGYEQPNEVMVVLSLLIGTQQTGWPRNHNYISSWGECSYLEMQVLPKYWTHTYKWDTPFPEETTKYESSRTRSSVQIKSMYQVKFSQGYSQQYLIVDIKTISHVWIKSETS